MEHGFWDPLSILPLKISETLNNPNILANIFSSSPGKHIQFLAYNSVQHMVGLIGPKTATIVFVNTSTHLMVPLCYFYPPEINYLLSTSVDS